MMLFLLTATAVLLGYGAGRLVNRNQSQDAFEEGWRRGEKAGCDYGRRLGYEEGKASVWSSRGADGRFTKR